MPSKRKTLTGRKKIEVKLVPKSKKPTNRRSNGMRIDSSHPSPVQATRYNLRSRSLGSRVFEPTANESKPQPRRDDQAFSECSLLHKNENVDVQKKRKQAMPTNEGGKRMKMDPSHPGPARAIPYSLRSQTRRSDVLEPTNKRGKRMKIDPSCPGPARAIPYNLRSQRQRSEVLEPAANESEPQQRIGAESESSKPPHRRVSRFFRLVRNIFLTLDPNSPDLMTSTAYRLLKEASKCYLVYVFQYANLWAIRDRRLTVQVRDMRKAVDNLYFTPAA